MAATVHVLLGCGAPAAVCCSCTALRCSSRPHPLPRCILQLTYPADARQRTAMGACAMTLAPPSSVPCCVVRLLLLLHVPAWFGGLQVLATIVTGELTTMFGNINKLPCGKVLDSQEKP